MYTVTTLSPLPVHTHVYFVGTTNSNFRGYDGGAGCSFCSSQWSLCHTPRSSGGGGARHGAPAPHRPAQQCHCKHV